MPNGKRLWRTASGDLVDDGHPDALHLAYGPDDDLRPGEKAAGGLTSSKTAPRTADKQARKPADK